MWKYLFNQDKHVEFDHQQRNLTIINWVFFGYSMVHVAGKMVVVQIMGTCWGLDPELVGGWNRPPLKNDGVRQWEGWHPIYEMENITCSKPPTSEKSCFKQTLGYQNPGNQKDSINGWSISHSPTIQVWAIDIFEPYPNCLDYKFAKKHLCHDYANNNALVVSWSLFYNLHV